MTRNEVKNGHQAGRNRREERRVNDDEERIALFLDYENLAIGAREALGPVGIPRRG